MIGTPLRAAVITTAACLSATALCAGIAQEKEDVSKYTREHYTKKEHQVPMRDGVRLFTAVYAPKDTSKKHPLLLVRTPYSVGPYGTDQYRDPLTRNLDLLKTGYIFVFQDVRGCFLSEGTFQDVRPHRPNKETAQEIDESTDTYDTIDWLLKNVSNHNGNVGQYGISYPGFYTSAGMIDAHPALKAASPQAPIGDWWYDDFHHHGALFLPHAFNFMAAFGQSRPEPTTRWGKGFEHGTPDGYQFFLDLGSLKNVNDRHFNDRIAFWNRLVEHPNYDEFWRERNILPHLKKVAPAVLTVGGWFDAEDLYGALNTYQAVEKQNPGIFNALVMGPWDHGGWSRRDGDRLGNIHFGAKTSPFYQKQMEAAFFEHFLKGNGEHRLPEAHMFETGANRWRQFDQWPPKAVQRKTLYFRDNGRLSFDPPPEEREAFDEYVSDPKKPVPYTESIAIGMTNEYMTDDQRFAARRPDVLVYQTDVLNEDLTLAGPIRSELCVSTSGTDSDWIVKLIDVFPPDAKDCPGMSKEQHLGGYQMMVRSEVMRGRFRNSYEKPEAFTPNTVTKVNVELQDVLHTFAKGHRVMIQVQSTWFPLVDRNPQKFVANIYKADDADFIKATQRVFRSKEQSSKMQVGVLAADAD